MSAIDVVIVGVVVALLVLGIRWLWRSNKDGCSDCGAAASCDHTHCAPTDDMLRRASQALGEGRR